MALEAFKTPAAQQQAPSIYQPQKQGEQSAFSKTMGNIWGGTKKVLGKVGDILGTSSYVMGGITRAVKEGRLRGFGEAFEEKSTVAEEFDIKNPWVGLAVDIITDPLTFASGGTSSFFKGGQIVKTAGKVLSPKGVKFAENAKRLVLFDRAVKGKTTVTKLLKNPSIVREAEQESLKVVAAQMAKDPSLIDKMYVGFRMPFAKKGIALMEVKTPEAFKRLGKAIGKTKYGAAVAKGFEETFDFLGRTFTKGRAQQSQTLRNELRLIDDDLINGVIKKEEAIRLKGQKYVEFETKLQAIDNKLLGTNRVLKKTADELTPIIKKTTDDQKVWTAVADVVEGIDNASTPQIIRKSIGKISRMVSRKEITAKGAKDMKEIVKGVVPLLKKLEGELLQAGILKKASKKAFWFRSVEGIAKKGFTGEQGMFKASKLMGRTADILESETGKRIGAKIGKDSASVRSRVSAKGVMKKQTKMKYVAKTAGKGQKAKIQKALVKEASKFKQKINVLKKAVTKKEKQIALNKKLGRGTKALEKDLKVLNRQVVNAEKASAKVTKDLTTKIKGMKDGDYYEYKGEKFRRTYATRTEIEKVTGIKYEGALDSIAKGLVKTGNLLETNKAVTAVVNAAKRGGADGLGLVKKGKHIKEGYVDFYKLTGNLPVAKGWIIPESMAKSMKGYIGLMSDEKEIGVLLKGFDKMTQYWKTYALVGVSYHARNFVSNSFNMWLGGVNTPFQWAKVASDMKAYKNLTKGGAKVSKEMKRHYKDFLESGAGGGEFMGAEAAKGIVDKVKGGNWNPFSTRNKLVKGSQKVGDYVENSQKFALYMNQVRKGQNMTSSSRHVKEFMFDYTDLSDTERRWFKRLLPFYTWSRKNIPLQLKELIKQPGKASTIQKIERTIEPENAAEIKEYLPEYLKDGHPIVLPFKNKKGDNYVMNLEGLLPVYDLTNVANFNFKTIFDMVNPLLKTPAEIGMNKNFFYDSQIKMMATEDTNLLMDLFDVPGMRKDEIKSKYMGGLFNEAQAHIIRQAFRPIRELDDLVELGLTEAEKKPWKEKIAKTLITSVKPVDVLDRKFWTDKSDNQAQEGLIKVYSSFVKKAQEKPSSTHIKNAEKARKTLIEIGVTEDQIKTAEGDAMKNVLKFSKGQPIIDKAVKEGKPFPSEELYPYAEEMKKYYTKKSVKSIMKTYKEDYDSRLLLHNK